MIYKIALTAGIVLSFVCSYLAHQRFDMPERPEISPGWRCERIVSMAPSLTETLYALGLGDRVVGVTRYCKYPPDVADKPRIGGYFDPNFEAILALHPDLVVMLEEHEQSLPAFKKLKLETRVVSHKTIEGIIDSFRSLGRTCGRGPEGRRMASDYEAQLRWIQRKTAGLPRPRVLVAIDRTPKQGHLTDVYVAGDDGYFDRMIELAGGENAYRENRVRYPVVSSEGIIWLNPDIIVDLVGETALKKQDKSSFEAEWDELGQVNAVKNHRVFVFGQDYADVPGPRFLRIVRDLARILHPDVDWRRTDEPRMAH